MASPNAIVFSTFKVLISAIDMTFPMGDMNARRPSGLKMRLWAAWLDGVCILAMRLPV